MGLQGTIIKGRFRIESLLTETDKSFIFLGVKIGAPDPDMPESQQVVIKVIKDRYRQRQRFLDNWTRELAITTRLPGHPGMVRYLDADLKGRRVYVVTVRDPEGVSVGESLAEGKELGYIATLGTIRGMADVLRFAASSGLNDRHVRLEDLLVNPRTGSTKLLKFSLPRAVRLGAAALRRGAGGPQGDLLHLGSTLYRLVCMSYPTDRWDLADESVHDQFVETLRARFPEDAGPEEIARVATVYRKLTTRCLEERFQTLDDVIQELTDLMERRNRVVDYRIRRDEWQKRQVEARELVTAYDTVAALRGVYRPPRDPEPSFDAPPRSKEGESGLVSRKASLAEHRALLWAQAEQEGILARWDTPAMVGAMSALGMSLFMISLYVLMFR